VEKTMQQVDGPVLRYGASSERPAVHTHGGIVLTVGV
jgi:hypothetical protein